MRMKHPVVAVLAWWTVAGAGETWPAAERESLRQQWETAWPGLIARYQLADALDRDGIGRSDATTSGALGWQESAYLRRYMMCYGATRDPYWLDRVIDHADRLFASLRDHDGDGLLSWQDAAYSVGLVEVVPQGAVGDLVVSPVPADGRVYVGRGGEQITGHTYRVEPLGAGRLAITDTRDGRLLSGPEGVAPGVVEVVPGVRLQVSGQGLPGAAVLVRTRAPEACEYQVHDGMIGYPVALFIEQVLADRDLPPAYGEKARQYLELLDGHFIRRWEKTWIDLPPDAGLYAFTDNPTQRFPGYSLPHNQYLAPARVCLVLAQLPGYPGAALCAERARKMATTFRRNLRETAGGAYVWNYWDPLPHENATRRAEDTSHATIDIGFAVEAWRRGVVFTRLDLERLARTYIEVMWDGNREDPRFGSHVDRATNPASMWSEWCQLAEVDRRVWELTLATFERNRRLPSMVPAMAELYDRLVGFTPELRRQCRAHTPVVLGLVRTPGLLNPGFEVESPGGGAPAGWTLGVWTPDDGSETAWVEDAHEGQRAIALVGKGAQTNAWAQSDRALRVETPGSTLRVTAWYRTDAETASPAISILAQGADGARVQYETSPGLVASPAWREAQWQIALAPAARGVRLMLRNRGPGRVLWDRVTATVEAPAATTP